MANAPEPEAPLMTDHPSRSIDSELTCREIANGVTDFLEERLSTGINMKVSDHLVSCTGCRTYVEQVALVRETLAHLPLQLPSPMIRLRLREHFVARLSW